MPISVSASADAEKSGVPFQPQYTYATILGRSACGAASGGLRFCLCAFDSAIASGPSLRSPVVVAVRRTVRSLLGRDGPNSLTRMVSAPRFGRPAPAEFGISSVGEGASVGPGITRRVSSTYSHRTGLSVGFKIRVSMVRFRPRPPFPTGPVRNDYENSE